MIGKCCGYMKSFRVRYFVSVVLLYLVDIVESQSIYTANYQPLSSGYDYNSFVDPNALPKLNSGINSYTLPTTVAQPSKWYAPTVPPTSKPEKSKWYTPSVVLNEVFQNPSDVALIEPSDFEDSFKDEWSFQDPSALLKPPANLHKGNKFFGPKTAKMIMMGIKMALMMFLGIGLPAIIAFHILVFMKFVVGFKILALSAAITVGIVALKYYLHHKRRVQAYLTALETIQTVADIITATGLPFWGPALLTSGASGAAALTGAAALFGVLFGNSTTTTTPAPAQGGRSHLELLQLPLPDQREPEEQVESQSPEESATPKPMGAGSVTEKFVQTTKDFLKRWKKFLIIS